MRKFLCVFLSLGIFLSSFSAFAADGGEKTYQDYILPGNSGMSPEWQDLTISEKLSLMGKDLVSPDSQAWLAYMMADPVGAYFTSQICNGTLGNIAYDNGDLSFTAGGGSASSSGGAQRQPLAFQSPVSSTGQLQIVLQPYTFGAFSGSRSGVGDLAFQNSPVGSSTLYDEVYAGVGYSFVAPVSGVYTPVFDSSLVAFQYDYFDSSWFTKSIHFPSSCPSFSTSSGSSCYFTYGMGINGSGGRKPAKWVCDTSVFVSVTPLGETQVKNYNTTINNTTYKSAYEYNNYIYAYDDSDNLKVYIQDDSGQIVGNIVNEGDVYNITINNVVPPSPTPTPSPDPTPTPTPGGSGGDSDNTDIIAFLTTAFADLTANIQGFFNGLAVGIAAGFADLQANFILAIDGLSLSITNYFDKKLPEVSTPETALPTPTPSPSPTPEPDAPIVIDKQPDNVSIKTGTTVKFSIEAHSTIDSDLSYFWEWSADDGASWRAVSQRVATISTATNLTMNGRLFRCTVSDADGNSLVSNSALLQVWETEPPPVVVPPSGGDTNIFNDSTTINNWLSGLGKPIEGLKNILFALPALLAAMFAYVLGMKEILVFVFPFFPDYIIVLLMAGMIISLLLAIIKFIRYMTS